MPRRSLNERLAEKTPRNAAGLARSSLVRTRTRVVLETPEEIAAAAIGAEVMRKLDEFGQTRVPARAIETLTEKLTANLTAKEVMELEVEAYEILDWLVGRVAEAAATAQRDGEDILYDPFAPTLSLIERAIAESFDLKIDYFSKRRGEMNTRRITPLRVRAETYVEAFCHARRAERVFRLNRITRAVPVRGQPTAPIPLVEARAEHEPEVAPRQLSLLDGD